MWDESPPPPPQSQKTKKKPGVNRVKPSLSFRNKTKLEPKPVGQELLSWYMYLTVKIVQEKDHII